MLTPQQREQFLTEGNIVIPGAFPPEDSLVWVRAECAQAGYDVDDPATWKNDYERINLQRHELLENYSPTAWQASCDLLGGAERVANKPVISLFAGRRSRSARPRGRSLRFPNHLGTLRPQIMAPSAASIGEQKILSLSGKYDGSAQEAIRWTVNDCCIL